MKPTQLQLEIIKYMVSQKDKYTYTDIAKTADLPIKTIKNICKYRNWNKHVKKTISEGIEQLIYLLSEIYPGEKIIQEYNIGSGLRLDIYIPLQNLAIEFDGTQHHIVNNFFHSSKADLQHQQNLDQEKNHLCKNKGIALIRINKLENIEIEYIKKQIEIARESKVEVTNGGKISSGNKEKNISLQKEVQKARRKKYLASEQHQELRQKQREYRKAQYRKWKENNK